MNEEQFNALTDEEREAIMAHRREMAGRVDEVLIEIEAQAQLADGRDDAKSAARLRAKVPGLKRKREEILSGKRS